MSKILFGFLCLMPVFVLSDLQGAQSYEYTHRFSLKKDEVGMVFINRKETIKRANEENPMNDFLLKVRWTLFANEQLFVLVNYRGHPYQYIMQKRYPLEKVSIPLLPDGENKLDAKVLAHIAFHDFDQRNKEAQLDILIEDNQERIRVEFKPKKN